MLSYNQAREAAIEHMVRCDLRGGEEGRVELRDMYVIISFINVGF